MSIYIESFCFDVNNPSQTMYGSHPYEISANWVAQLGSI